MKFLISVLFVITIQLSLSAQFTVQGTVISSASQSPVEFAAVALVEKGTGNMLAGTTTDASGKFELETKQENFAIKITFIGYKRKLIRKFAKDQPLIDLGEILLEEDSELLEEVVVTAEKSTTEFKLDKRVFNVGRDLSSTGASALELLNNVPSVDVNIEGEISLRGATGVQILIDGKPSVLADEASSALGSITADMIEKIELITNPSAKYEAEGTAGIINIVLKKNEKKGINGSVSLNTGIPHNHSLGFSLNNRTSKFNLFTQLGMGYRALPSDTENITRDLVRSTTLTSVGREFRNEVFYNVILGSDYYINENNVLTLSGRFAYEVEDQPSDTEFEFLEQDSLVRAWDRNEVTSATNPKLTYELKYKRDFKDHKEHDLLFSTIGNYFGKDLTSDFTNAFTTGMSDQVDQKTATSFNEGKYTFKLDYSKPFNKQWSMETGAQYLLNNVNNDFEVSNQNTDGSYAIDSSLTNVFEYNQNVLGLYATSSYEGTVWGIKLGLRVENTDLYTRLVNNNKENDRNFNNFFPTLHSSYKFSERVSFQAGYSRRILRPRLWNLNPFFNIRNNFVIMTGNPDLLPEFTDSYEIGGVFIYDKVSLNSSIYHRYTTESVERVSSFNNGVTTWMPINVGTNKATGVELNLKYTVNRKLSFNGDANYNTFFREGNFNDQDFDFNADQWSGKLTSRYKLNKKFDTELTVRYGSRVQTVQGMRAANIFTSLGMRYKVLKKRGVFNFSVRDIFASRIRKNTVETDTFYSYAERFRGRFVTLGFSYGFGKGEAMQYSGRRRH